MTAALRRRTYWHLEDLPHKPTDYEIATSELLYYPSRGFEIRARAGDWHVQQQQESSLHCAAWERFADPRETTYARYTALQRDHESFAEGLCRVIDETDYDRNLAPDWLETLEQVLPTLRFPAHGLQMVAAYVAHMAPSGRIVVCGMFQCADEIRRIQRLAYRTAQLQRVNTAFGRSSKTRWELEPQWQPLREVVERLLVRYDWCEALVALNLVLKPAFDGVLMPEFAAAAKAHGDDLLGRLLFSLEPDYRWHRRWSTALVRLCLDDHPDDRRLVDSWVARWRERVAPAITTLAESFGRTTPVAAALESTWKDVLSELDAERNR